jgi:hypothetical protein
VSTRSRLKWSAVLITLLAAVGCAFSNAWVAAALLLLAALTLVFIRPHSVPSQDTLQRLEQSLNPPIGERTIIASTRIRGTYFSWSLMVEQHDLATRNVSRHLVFRDEVDEAMWRRLIVAARHGDAQRH